MTEIHKVAKQVREVLKTHPQTRNSDCYLYYIICRDRLAALGLDIERVSLSNGLLYRNSYSLPNYETVRRARQKLQAQHPELASDPEVEAVKIEKEDAFREYAREGVVV